MVAGKSPLAPLHISKKIAQWLVIRFLTAKKTLTRSLYRFFPTLGKVGLGKGTAQKKARFRKKDFSRGICWVMIIHNPLLWVLSDTLATERPQKLLPKLGNVNFCLKKLMRTKSQSLESGIFWRNLEITFLHSLKTNIYNPWYVTIPRKGKIVFWGVISNNLKTTESPSSWDSDSFISRSRLATSDGWSIVEGHLVAVDEALTTTWKDGAITPDDFFPWEKKVEKLYRWMHTCLRVPWF